MKKLLFFLSLIIIISFPILFTEDKKIQNSFYHWKNTYDLKNTNEKLYIKVLDISFSKKLEYVSTKFNKEPKNSFVPTIYITNETMKKVDYKEIEKLILKQIKRLNTSFEEIQIDCDWSLTSKSNYFNLLQALKKDTNKTISATIRLHQIKYFKKTGVPPVDYGVLMYYNMSDITDFNSKNSILDNSIAKKYHYNFDVYKLKLKLALPLYSQAIWFRDKKPLDIFEGVIKDDFKNHFDKISENIYKVKKSTYFKGRYIYKDDLFRFEDSKYEDLQEAIKDFYSLNVDSFNEIIYYRYSYKNKYNLSQLLKESL
ncbi:hypothetical protein [Poseidonibacter lekithochrous]|uniref:hypothetical protein n=1 Tax=Poseidonibacter lekithochrous TaxID=1904463 RepID=UPI0008FC33DA|nr:hypothetical protein [Poseidonibacter lekithochrous]QKJ22574.1 hypothetical protein ALEK_1299 [Poseidonibacter lekithochrous]